jgi:hypothetical protein
MSCLSFSIAFKSVKLLFGNKSDFILWFIKSIYSTNQGMAYTLHVKIIYNIEKNLF